VTKQQWGRRGPHGRAAVDARGKLSTKAVGRLTSCGSIWPTRPIGVRGTRRKYREDASRKTWTVKSNGFVPTRNNGMDAIFTQVRRAAKDGTRFCRSSDSPARHRARAVEERVDPRHLGLRQGRIRKHVQYGNPYVSRRYGSPRRNQTARANTRGRAKYLTPARSWATRGPWMGARDLHGRHAFPGHGGGMIPRPPRKVPEGPKNRAMRRASSFHQAGSLPSDAGRGVTYKRRMETRSDGPARCGDAKGPQDRQRGVIQRNAGGRKAMERPRQPDVPPAHAQGLEQKNGCIDEVNARLPRRARSAFGLPKWIAASWVACGPGQLQARQDQRKNILKEAAFRAAGQKQVSRNKACRSGGMGGCTSPGSTFPADHSGPRRLKTSFQVVREPRDRLGQVGATRWGVPAPVNGRG